ncbi:dnaJsubfamily B member 6-A [Dorcoceras hygrometricum]|uniref:DnaJsubfamily B member 6-A n=1 Tax=Dorcoceras hygrometricum TaxID=472368 RepID=A0A2Z7CG25_9LAMI|nr:dnaJsubfamily B member 6-A [Dorcoceras hygrometricum]
MADGMDKSNDFYAVLGLKKDCTTAELRNAYKKLALKWHPDRCCSATGSARHLEEAKMKFQAIQQAYSVLSNNDKRFLYDLGVYDCEDDDDENGMGDFLNEMVSMMSQSNENGNESLEDLQELFYDMFDSDIDSFGSSSSSPSCYTAAPTYFSSPNPSYSKSHCKRNFSGITGNSKPKSANFKGVSEGVELGARTAGRAGDNRRNGRKRKIMPGQDVSSTVSV